MPALDSGVLVALALAGLLTAVGVIWLAKGKRTGPTSRRALHGMAKDESVSYFRDYGSSEPAPGVREEDRTGRWGEGGNKPS